MSVQRNADDKGLTGAILAGGKSSRMGQNKALAEVNGRPMVAHVADTVKNVARNTIISSNEPEAFDFLGLPVFVDAIESCGPLAGIYTALKHAETRHCLVVACDLPFLTQPLLRFLCENCLDHDILAFDSGKGVEPLCAVYSKACLPVIAEQVQKGNRRVQDLFSQVKTRIVQMEAGLFSDSANAFLNVNTPEELSRARKIRDGHTPQAAKTNRDQQT